MSIRSVFPWTTEKLKLGSHYALTLRLTVRGQYSHSTGPGLLRHVQTLFQRRRHWISWKKTPTQQLKSQK